MAWNYAIISAKPCTGGRGVTPVLTKVLPDSKIFQGRNLPYNQYVTDK